MNIVVGSKLKFGWRSKKGNERIKQWGSENWVVTKITKEVLFSKEKGPWLFIENGHDNASRWIHEQNDQDFKIINIL